MVQYVRYIVGTACINKKKTLLARSLVAKTVNPSSRMGMEDMNEQHVNVLW